MTTLMTRILRDPQHCALCQLGQGRACVCEEKCRRTPKQKPRRPVSDTEWIWLLIVADVACLVGAVALWRAFA